MKGRPRLSDRIKAARGTQRSDRAANLSVNNSILATLPPPDSLNVNGRTEWVRLVALLDASGVLARVDYGLLLHACLCYQMVIDLQGVLASEGYTYTSLTSDGNIRAVVAHPAYKMMLDAMQRYREIVTLFGVSTAGRLRLSLDLAKEKEEGEPDLLPDSI